MSKQHEAHRRLIEKPGPFDQGSERPIQQDKDGPHPGWVFLGVVVLGGLLTVASPTLGSLFGIIVAAIFAVHVFRS